MHFNDHHRDILRTICDSLIPAFDVQSQHHEQALFWKRKASDLHVAEAILSVINSMPIEVQKDFEQVLNLLDSALFLGFTTGNFNDFASLSPEKREETLQKFANHWLPPLRQIFTVLKKLTTFIYYGTSFDNKDNPNWAAIGYSIPKNDVENLQAPKKTQEKIQRPIKPIDIFKDTVLSCEILIIGSGAGGGVVAGELAEAGLEVIVAEKGIYLHDTEFSNREAESVAALYDAKGLLATKDGSMTIFAGSNLGGGTTINWSGSLKTPDYILEEWAKEADLPFLLTPEYQKGFEAVMQATKVSTNETIHNAQNQMLWQGSEKLGHLLKLMPRNTAGCLAHGTKECGYCSLGCKHGAKMSMTKTYLQRAFDKGAKIITQLAIEKILIENGKAIGAVGTYYGFGEPKKVEIKAKKVVVAAGSIQTPALLLRSGLQHSAIGKHLYLHPTTVVSAIYPQMIKSWEGVMMSAINDEFSRMTGNFGFKIETPPVHAGLFGLGMPWVSAKQHKELVLKAQYAAHFIILTRDKFGGSVKINKYGRPEVQYRLHDFDKQHILRGLAEGIKIHLAAGAKEAYLAHNELKSYKAGEGLSNLETTINSLKWQANRFGLFSAHQMGTCRMGGNRKTHAAKPTGELYEVKNLYVADGSLFPLCSGVNPMLSIQTLAYWVAKGMRSEE
jgi:choline dehydrogenase-like flavoprotein